jgi:iron complex transport system substrate-binding protein
VPAALLLLLLLLSALSPVREASAAGRHIQVIDDSQRVVSLAAPARRIVTLSPHATELVFAAGAGARLVAVAAHSDYPPPAARLPVIGGLHGLDRERLLALRPDLVVAWRSGNSAADLAWLDSLGLATYHSEPRSLLDIAKTLEDLGRLAGTLATARKAAQHYRAGLADACPHRGNDAAAPVFVQLAARPPLTIGGGHWLDEALQRAGLRNVYRDLPARAQVVSRESLLVRQPYRVLYLAHPGATPPTVDAIGLDPALWARPGPRLPQGISALCRQLAEPPGRNQDR